jgi:hypothetical protein
VKTVLAKGAPWPDDYKVEKPKFRKKPGRSKPDITDKNFTKWANTQRLDCAKVFGDAQKVS